MTVEMSSATKKVASTKMGRQCEVESEFVDAMYLQQLTGTKASTWRYWASTNQGPSSFRLGRRRVWRKSDVLAWISEQQGADKKGPSL